MITDLPFFPKNVLTAFGDLPTAYPSPQQFPFKRNDIYNLIQNPPSLSKLTNPKSITKYISIQQK